MTLNRPGPWSCLCLLLSVFGMLRCVSEPGAPADPTPTPTPEGPAEELKDLSIPLSEIPAAAYASILATDVNIGTNLRGEIPAEALRGEWTGTLLNNELGAEIDADMVFDDAGNLLALYQRIEGFTINLDFVTQEIKQYELANGNTAEVRPVASSVEANPDGTLTITTAMVQDGDSPTGQRTRIQESWTMTVTVDDAAGTITGTGLIVDDVINSAVPGAGVGEIIRLSFQIDLARTEMAPGRARLLVGDFERPMTELDDVVLKAVLPAGYELGASVSGAGEAAGLAGEWTGKLTGGTGYANATWGFEFDATGRLIGIVRGSSASSAVELDMVTRTTFTQGSAVYLPVASLVRTEDGREIEFEFFYLVDGINSDDNRFRVMNRLTYTTAHQPSDEAISVTGAFTQDLFAHDDPTQSLSVTEYDGSSGELTFGAAETASD